MADKTTTEEQPEEPFIRPFADWLREQSKGSTHEELSEALRDLVNRVLDTQKKGVLQFTITVAPLKGGDIDALVVHDQIKLKLPEHDRPASLFYPTDEGNLSRQDPHQLSFDSLREVPDVGVVNTETGEVRGAEA